MLVFRWSILATGVPVKEWKVLRDDSSLFQEKSIKKTFYKVLKKPSVVKLRAILDTENLKTKVQKPLYLYIPQIDTSYFEVHVDGKLIGSYGFENDRTAHVWYQPFFFKLPESFTEKSNIDFVIAGVYEIGIDFPVKIIDESQKWKYTTLSFLTNIALPISTGLALTLSVILYSIAMNLSASKKEIYRHLAIASFFGAIWMFDLFPFPTMGSELTFLILRKIFVASGYIGFAALFYGFNKEISNGLSIRDKIVIIVNFSAAFAVFLAFSNYNLKLLTNYISVILIFNSAYLFIKSLRMYSRLLFGFVMFFVYTTIHDGMTLFFSTNSKLLSGFGIVSLFAGFSYTLVKEYKEMMVQITMSHLRSITDPLTGAYNRGAISEMIFTQDDTFVYIDMDKFKEINDKHGHDVGDEILKLLVSTIKKNIRSNDVVVRMGGDEFLVVLKNCPMHKAEEIFAKILSEFSASHNLKPNFSYGVVQYQVNLERTIRAVDDLMYKMKELKRQSVH